MAAGDSHEWRFTALVDGQVIGYHAFHVVEQGAKRSLISEARFDVKFLFMHAYHYMHESKEIWRGDCLTRIDARTDDDGKHVVVSGARNAEGFRVETPRGSAQLPDCVMTFAYWNPRILDAKHLLNAQTGEYLDVRVEALGPDIVAAHGAPRPAQHYALKTDKFAVDLWYSPQREWLARESVTESGRRLRYRID